MSRQACRVLIADDDKDTADATAELLHLCGDFETRAVYNGLQAVEAARTFQPDVVILDINMPVMDGYEAATSLKNGRSSVVCPFVLALTNCTQPADVERGRRAGFDHHLTKPASADTLCAVINSFMVRARERTTERHVGSHRV